MPLASGKAFIAGLFTRYNNVACPGVALVNEDGSLDPSFAPRITVPAGGGITTLVVDGQQRVYLGGNFTAVEGAVRSGIARVDFSGRLETAFAPELPVGSSIAAISFTSGGDVLVGGSLRRVDSLTGLGGLALQKLRADGRVDPAFQAPLMQAYNSIPFVYRLAVLPDGRFLAGGEFSSVAGITRSNICRLRADGSLDTSYTASVPLVWTQINDIDLLPDGGAYISGDFVMLNDFEPGCIARLTPSGAADRTFKFPLTGGTGNGRPSVNNLLVLADGRLLAVGNFRNANGVARAFLARTFSDGIVDSSFTAGTDNEIVAVAEDAKGRFWIGGAFSSLDGAPAPGIARIVRTGGEPIVRNSPGVLIVRQGANFLIDPQIVGADSVQWFRNGTPIAGATGTALALAVATKGGRRDLHVSRHQLVWHHHRPVYPVDDLPQQRGFARSRFRCSARTP